MSQQLRALEEELRQASDPALRIELNARMAICLARLSRFDEARSQLRAVRDSQPSSQIGPAHVWIMLAEALLEWYATLNSNALDRVKRVQVLSSAMRYREMHALASAWRAHIQFELSDFEGMVRSIQLARENDCEGNKDAATRVAIVLFNAFSIAGSLESAQVWFGKARAHALSVGDLPSVEAIQYNKAVLAVACLRADAALGVEFAHLLRPNRSEIESSKNLQLLTGNQTLMNHLHVADARLCLYERRFEAAIERLTFAREQKPFSEHHMNRAATDLEIAWALSELGKAEESRELFGRVDQSSLASLEIDDQLVAYHLSVHLGKLFGLSDLTAACEERKRSVAATYSESRASLLKQLQTLQN